jgi:hypothetical protein
MKVGAMIEPRLPGATEFAVAAERIGVDSLWIPEVWGYDALTGLAYLAAKTSSVRLGTFVVQLGSRTPALLATSALSLQELSAGRDSSWASARRAHASWRAGTACAFASRCRPPARPSRSTLLAKLEGDHGQQLATLQRLVAITQAA